MTSEALLPLWCLSLPPVWGLSVRPTALRGQCTRAGQGVKRLSETILRSQVLEIRFLMEKLVLCDQSPTQSTSPDKSVSNSNHRGVPALGSRKPHFEIFQLKPSRLARSSKNNIYKHSVRQGLKVPPLSYLDFLVLVQLLTSRHKSLVWLIVLGLPGATQVLREISAWWCAQKQVQMKRHFMTDKKRTQHRLDFSLALAWEKKSQALFC